jgi:hypothetical protein
MTSSTSTHLPLLPSERKKKLLQQSKHRTGEGNDLSQQQKAKQGLRNENGDDSIQGIVSDQSTRTASSLESTIKHPCLSLSIHHDMEQKSSPHAKGEELKRGAGQLKKIVEIKGKGSSTPSQESKDTNGEVNYHEQLKEEQLGKFSSLPPLSASTTTNAVMHFMHTTLTFMNSFSAEVEEKLELCENSIEDLEIKLSLIENKLNSVQLTSKVKDPKFGNGSSTEKETPKTKTAE